MTSSELPEPTAQELRNAEDLAAVAAALAGDLGIAASMLQGMREDRLSRLAVACANVIDLACDLHRHRDVMATLLPGSGPTPE